MGKSTKEIKIFNKGIVSAISLTDSADETAQFSLNVEPITKTGVLQGITTDTGLFPDGPTSFFTKIDKMVLLDRGTTEDLFFHSPYAPEYNPNDYGLNYFTDWYGSKTMGSEWYPTTCTIGAPCFAKHNKEAHIGFGSLAGDSSPKWMGYTKNKQFGSRVSTSILIEDAELKSPDLGNAIYAMDKVITLEAYFGARPHSNNATYTVTIGGTQDGDRWTEELGTNTWRYGIKIGEPYIYRIKTEPSNTDPAIGGGNVMGNTAAGKFIRSNPIMDTQGKLLRISSIAPSRKFKNAVWVTSNEFLDKRVLLIDVNDFHEVHDPTAILSSNNVTWSFKVDTHVLGEYALDFPTLTTPDGDVVDELPLGDWKVSDIVETFECSNTVYDIGDSSEEADTQYTTDANEHAYHGATGKLLDCRLWVQLHKNDGFSNGSYNTVAVEPFLYSTDLMPLEYTNMSDSFNMVNETLPFRRLTSKTNIGTDGVSRKVYYHPEWWTFDGLQGGNFFSWGSTTGWDGITWHESSRWDADGSYGTIPFGWNVGFSDNDEGGRIEVKEHSLAWLYGRGGYDAYYTATTFDNCNGNEGYTPHQVGVLCFSDSEFVTDAGGFTAKWLGMIEQDAWVPTHSGKTTDLGIFLMVSNHSYLGNGYQEAYSVQSGELWSDGDTSSQPTNIFKKSTEMLSLEKDKMLYTLSSDYDSLNWEGIKSFVVAYNNKLNDDTSNHSTGSLIGIISEGVSSDPDIDLFDDTKLWPFEIRNFYNSSQTSREGELQEMRPPQTVALNVDVPPFTLKGIGTASISIDWNWWYPSSATEFYDGLNEWALNLFCSATEGEHASGMAFLNNDATQQNTTFWAINSPSPGNAVDAGLTNWVMSTDNILNLLEDDATIIFTNGDESQTAPHGFDDDVTYRYKMSFMYDSYQHSPLTNTTWSNTITTSTGNSGLDTVSIELNIPENLPKRVSHVLLWRSNDLMDSYKLVSQLSLKGGWAYDDELECWKHSVLDKGQNIVGESYTCLLYTSPSPRD